jgi:cbb3-type cytochrome oxidase subunit 3
MTILQHLLAGIDLLSLPIVSMCMFLLLFVAVVWRVSRKSRAPEYRRMASLPLDGDEERQDHD